MILDATAGNRTMWKRKQSDNIIYIDIQRQLEVRPTIFCSNEQLPFPDATFDTIFFDPPHGSGYEGSLFSFPMQTAEFVDKWKMRRTPTYYGIEMYKSTKELLRHVCDAQRELFRVLKDDGLLWFKWNELEVKLDRVLTWMTEWQELMRVEVKGGSHLGAEHKTYWVCLEKRVSRNKQSTLCLFEADDELPKPVLELRKPGVFLTDYLG